MCIISQFKAIFTLYLIYQYNLFYHIILLEMKNNKKIHQQLQMLLELTRQLIILF